jgi:LacI family repressor for deo operon, udp, cdd, tsx, nupC, and nupG
VAATIYDVARHAGVSPRTVSNVVNDYQYVSDAMRERVRKSIDELGYRPNLLARGLRSGRTRMITLAVPELAVPYFSELSGSIISELASRGYTVNVRQTNGLEQFERTLMGERGLPPTYDGLIFSPLGLEWSELVELASTNSQPLVLLGEQVTDGIFDHVFIDNAAAARAATEHLISLGRRRIAAIGHQPTSPARTAQLRTNGYRAALAAAGFEQDPSLLVSARVFHRREGFEAMASLLRLGSRPDAVFCFNDLLAEGAIRAALTSGLRVPEDIAVIGFDGTEEGSYSTPTLSTVTPDTRAIAQKAVDQLILRIEGDEQPPAALEAPFVITPRESTLGAAAVTAG